MPIIKAFRGKLPTIHPEAFIAENAVIVGDVTIHAGASIWYGCVLRGDVAPIVVGENSNIQDGSVIHVASQELNGTAIPTVIGRHVTVGHMALLHACTLEDESFVGMQSCVMDGARIQRHGMLGAGALLASHKTITTGELWLGRPASFKRQLSQDEIAFITTSAMHYVEFGRTHANENPLH
jgi:gamma-carbonic anhydrase